MVKTIFKKISYFNNFLTTLVLLLHRARLSCRKTNTKVITTANHINGKHHRLPMRTQVKTSKLPKARESAGKRGRPSHDKYSFRISLVESMA